MTPRTVDLRTVDLDDLVPWGRNPRKNEAAILPVATSIARFGIVAPIVVRHADRPPYQILAGHTRVAAIRALMARTPNEGGWDAVPFFRTSPPIPAHFVYLEEGEALAYALADNRLHEIATWDPEALAQVLADLEADGTDLDGLGWTYDDLEAIRARLDPEPEGSEAPGGDPDPEGDPYEAPDLAGPVESVSGTVYRLGPHILYCGDSLADDIPAILSDHGDGLGVEVVVTDPPYVIFGSSTGVSSDTADDEMVIPFFRSLWRRLAELLALEAHFWMFCDWRTYPTIHRAAKSVRECEIRNVAVWDKGSGVGSSLGNAHEFVIFGGRSVPASLAKAKDARAKRGYPAVRPAMTPNIFRVARTNHATREHNAAKPVPLLRRFVEVSTCKPGTPRDLTEGGRWVGAPEGWVLDLFGGSGSTLIAAAEEGRRAFLVEKEPRWVDVIRRRWTRWAIAHNVDPGEGALGPSGARTETEDEP